MCTLEPLVRKRETTVKRGPAEPLAHEIDKDLRRHIEAEVWRRDLY